MKKDLYTPKNNEFFVVQDLQRFKTYLKRQSVKGIAIDIDDTISFTQKTWGSYLIQHFGNPENLTITQISQKYGYFQNYWGKYEVTEALEWMETAIIDDAFQETFDLIEGAGPAVSKIHSVKPVLLYATNRPACVTMGTLNWLRKKGFPPAGLAIRPDELPQEEGYAWKAELLTALYPYIQGVVDDHPKLIANLHPDYPGTVYLFDHTEVPETQINVIPCKNWKAVISEIAA